MSSTPLIPFRGSYPALPEMSPGKFDLVQRKFWKKLKFVFRSTVGLGGFFFSNTPLPSDLYNISERTGLTSYKQKENPTPTS